MKIDISGTDNGRLVHLIVEVSGADSYNGLSVQSNSTGTTNVLWSMHPGTMRVLLAALRNYFEDIDGMSEVSDVS